MQPPGLSIPANGQHQGGWRPQGRVSPVCLLSNHQDSLQGVRNEALLCSSRSRSTIQAIMGGGPGQGHSGTLSRAGPHMVVFSLGRKKKETGCKHKLYFLKESVSHACLFISPGSTGSSCCETPGCPGCPFHVPQPCVTVAPANCFVSIWAELVFSLQNRLAAQDCSSVWLSFCHPATPSLPSLILPKHMYSS